MHSVGEDHVAAEGSGMQQENEDSESASDNEDISQLIEKLYGGDDDEEEEEDEDGVDLTLEDDDDIIKGALELGCEDEDERDGSPDPDKEPDTMSKQLLDKLMPGWKKEGGRTPTTKAG